MKKTVLPKDYPELDFNLMTITLIEGGDRLLGSMSTVSSKHVKKFLEKRGVKVLVNTRVSGFDGDILSFTNGETIVTKTLIWAAGVKATLIPGIDPSCIHASGRISVDKYNLIEGYENIYSIGDVCISLEDPKFPKGHPQIAQPAMQQGVLLASNFKNKSLSKPLKSFSYKDLGSMATVGRNFAVVELPFFKFQGFRAWLFWMLVHLMSIVGVKNRLLIFINWVWNYISYDQSLRLIIKPRHKEIE
jgi:NADH dehydrogenase